jgi:hypothetical protein
MKVFISILKVHIQSEGLKYYVSLKCKCPHTILCIKFYEILKTSIWLYFVKTYVHKTFLLPIHITMTV